MAVVEKRTKAGGGVAYRVRFFDNGKRESETFSTLADAKSFALHAEAAGGWPRGWTPGHGWEQPRPLVPTCDEWAERGIAGRARASARTRGDYARQWSRHVSPTFGAVPLDEVSPAAVRQWATELLDTVSPKTAANIHGLFSSVLQDAVTEGLIPRNPAKGAMPKATAPVDEMVFLTPPELERLLAAMPGHYRPLVLFLATTGLRFGEATALLRRDVDPAARTVTVHRAWKRQPGGFIIGPPKTQRGRRTVTLPAATVDALIPLLVGGTGDLLFTTPGGGPVRHANFYNRVWRPALEVADLPRRPRIHDLRHTHAAWLLSSGLPAAAVQRRLGHESIQTTVDRYGHLFADVDDRAASTVDALMVGGHSAHVSTSDGDSATVGRPK